MLSDFQLATLSISSLTPFARFTVRALPPGGIVNIDNFVFSTSPNTGTPEPGTIGLMSMGAAFLLFGLRCKFARRSQPTFPIGW